LKEYLATGSQLGLRKNPIGGVISGPKGEKKSNSINLLIFELGEKAAYARWGKKCRGGGKKKTLKGNTLWWGGQGPRGAGMRV